MRFSVIMPAGGRSFAARVRQLAGALVAGAVLGGCSFITGVPDVDRVSVTVTPSTIAVGQPAAVSGQAFNGSSVVTHSRRVVTFRSTNTAIATVAGSGSGQVFGVAPGTAYIVGESGGKRDSVLVTVTPPPAGGITPNPEFPVVTVGDTLRVRVNAFNTAGQPLTTFTLDCQSSIPAVMTASASGQTCLLRGLASGPVTLRLTVNGISTKDVNVVVQPTPITRLDLTVRSPVRETERLSPTLRAFNGATEVPTVGRAFVFTSSDNAVAAVDPVTGVINALAEGTTTITVRGENNVSAAATLRVTKIPVVTVLLPQTPTYRVGAQNSLVAAAYDSVPRLFATLAGRSVSYRVTDPTVLTVAQNGIVNPLKEGATTVTVTVDGVTSNTSAVTVTAMPVGAVRIDSATVTRNPGQTFQYTATVRDSLGRLLTDRRITWQSSNPAVVTVNSATGLARAEAPGGANVFASVEQVAPSLTPVVSAPSTFIVAAVPVARVVADPTSLTIRAGQISAVALRVEDANGNQLLGRTIVPIPSNPAIVSADGTGRIQGLQAGTATITYQAVDAANQPQGTPATVTVTVTASVAAKRATP